MLGHNYISLFMMRNKDAYSDYCAGTAGCLMAAIYSRALMGAMLMF